MARLARAEVFAPDEVAVVHVMNRVVRRCFLLGIDSLTGKNYDHRKGWIEELLQRFASCFGIDLLGYAILSNHFHLILRSRPDVVATWDDTEVARRWLTLCPYRKNSDGIPEEPNEFELNTIRSNPQKLAAVRLRLSDIGWWMRLLCQTVAMRANQEDQELGRFWQSRFRAVRLLDDAAIAACAAYVDLNPIRAGIAASLETSEYTSVQQRIQAEQEQAKFDRSASKSAKREMNPENRPPSANSVTARHLAPLMLNERSGEIGPMANTSGGRCSDKGFLPMEHDAYLKLLNWTASHIVKKGRIRVPAACRPVLDQLEMEPRRWLQLVSRFGRLFYNVAGRPQTIDLTRTRVGQHRYHLRTEARELFAT